jgi:DNA-directed RNA polymerase subunit RPC12/RpoP
MTEKPRRPILHLKFPPSTPIAVPGAPAAPAAATPPPAPRAMNWKCKPCGKPFQVLSELTDADSVRCPACNARLGLAGDFRAEPPELEKVRARLALEPAPKPPAPKSLFSPRKVVRVSTVSRRER